MKTYLIALFCLAVSTLMGQVPNLVNYQGRVAVGTVNFDGTGQFKFALVNAAGTTSYWSHDGTSTAGSEPTAALSLPVSRGLYQVLLGDTGIAGMSAIPASVWANAEVRLRVWFNDGTNGFQLLTPDQRLAPIGYLPDGSVTEAKVSDGAVTGAKIAAGTVGSAQLAANAVQAGNIATGAVTGAKLASGLTLSGTTSGTFSGSGSGLTSLNATNVTSGTLPDARLSSNVVLLTATQTLTNKTITGTFTGPLAGNATTATSATSFTGTLAGDVTGTQGATSIAAATVTGKALTGFVSGAGTVSATDTILTAINKLNGNVAMRAPIASPTFTGTVTMPAGTNTVSPLRLQTGVNLTTPVFGSVEFDGTNLYLTNNSGTPTRKTLAFTDSAISGSGAGLTNLNASSMSSGTLPDARLSSNVVHLNSTQTLTNKTISGSFTGPLTGNVTGNVSGSAASFTGSLAGDVTGTQSATSIASGAVTSAKIATGAVQNEKIADGAVTSAKLGSNLTLSGTTSGTFSGDGFGLTNVDLSSLILDKVPNLLAFGVNTFGQLGDGSATQRTSPVQVGTATNWQSVSAGFQHTMAVRSDGTLWAWGGNGFGQLGDGSATSRTSPVQVGAATNWQSVAAGDFHTVAIRNDGTLWTWGRNTFGQLGDGTTTNRNSPVQIGTATTWQFVSAGQGHTVAVRSDGTLWAWGLNTNGQLGLGDTTQRTSPVQVGMATNWQSVAAGPNHTLAVRSDGTLWAWGLNNAGQLGDGTMTTRTSPVQVGTATNWQSVSAGSSYTLAVRSDGTLWAWGNNGTGQLGDGTTTQRTSPVQVGTATTWQSVATGGGHTLAVRSDGTLWAWGNNPNGQLGLGDTTNRTSPVQVGTATTWQSVAAGEDHTVAVRSGASTASVALLTGNNVFQGSVTVQGDYIGKGHLLLHAYEGDGSNGTAFVQARDDSGTSSIGLTLRTQNGGSFVNAASFAANGNLTVIGNAFKPGGGMWSISSDRRLKKDIQPLTGALDRLMELRSVTYEYKDPHVPGYAPGTQTGFIAQEVEPHFPDWVQTGEDGMKILSITGFESLTVQALRELREEKDAEMKAKDEKIADLEARLAKLEQMMLGDGAAKKALVSMKKEARP